MTTLVERLRSMHSDPIGCGLARQWYVNPDGPEAADAIEELEKRNTQLHGQLVATLAGTYNVAPVATTTMCGRLDESGQLLADVKQIAASLLSIKPDAARAALERSNSHNGDAK